MFLLRPSLDPAAQHGPALKVEAIGADGYIRYPQKMCDTHLRNFHAVEIALAKHRPRCFLVPLLTQAFDSAASEMCSSCAHRPALRPVSGLIITFSPRPLQFLHFRVYNWPVPAQ